MYIIAEIGQAHDGSLGMAHSFIEALLDTGVNAIKFQTHIAEAESSIYEPFRINFSYEDKTRYDYWKRMEFNLNQWKGLKEHCEKLGMDFISSPFSNKAVDLLEKIGTKTYKIGSGEINNLLLLKKISLTGKPIIISSGMSSIKELEETTKFLTENNVDFSILQATTSYPTIPENYGLNVIQDLKKLFPNKKIGYSDHSGRIEVGIAAFILGAEILEFHITFDKRMFGPDSTSSLTIDEAKKMVRSIRNLEKAFKHPVEKKSNTSFKDLKKIFEKSLAVNKNMSEGDIITFNDLEAKKPKGQGINANEYKNVIGKKINKNLKKWDFIKYSDLL